MYVDYIDTPIGLMACQASKTGIVAIYFCETKKVASLANQHTERCKKQLLEYFSGIRKTFDLSLEPKGSEFQKSVWLCLMKIPYGKLLSYADVARRINNPKASQAVGGANAKNPLAIVVPCHRVIGSTGALTGYAGGLHRKRWLLQHEGIIVSNEQADIARY